MMALRARSLAEELSRSAMASIFNLPAASSVCGVLVFVRDLARSACRKLSSEKSIREKFFAMNVSYRCCRIESLDKFARSWPVCPPG